MKTNVCYCIISRSFLLRMEMFQTNFAEKIKTHSLCSVTISESRTFYEIMWKNIVERGRPQR